MTQSVAIFNRPNSCFQCQFVGKTLLLGNGLLILAKAVARAALGVIARMVAWSTCNCWKGANRFADEQFLESYVACAFARRAIFRHHSLLSEVQEEKTEEMSGTERERRVVDAKKISGKLERELGRIQHQGREKNFEKYRYVPAPENNGKEISLGKGLQIGTCNCLATSFLLKIGEKQYPGNLFQLFDGGQEASSFVEKSFERVLCATLQEFNREELTEKGIWNGLKQAFVRVDGMLKKNNRISEQGTSALVVMLLDGKLWTANAGDSRAFLVRPKDEGRGLMHNNNPPDIVFLSEPANPTDLHYKKGIEKRGGSVGFSNLLNNQFPVARSLQSDFVAGMSARPKITRVPLKTNPLEDILVVASNGMFEKTDANQLGIAVVEHSKESTGIFVQNLIYSAKQAGASGNLSAMVVKF